VIEVSDMVPWDQRPILFADVNSFMLVPIAGNELALRNARADAVIVGLPFDGYTTTTGRCGLARAAPQIIRKLSAMYQRGCSEEHGFTIFDHLRVVDFGDAHIVLEDAVQSFDSISRKVALAASEAGFLLMFGGDHAVTYPAFRGVVAARRRPIGLIQFDAHTDLRDEYQSMRLGRGSPTRRIIELPGMNATNVVQIGIRGFSGVEGCRAFADEQGIHVIGAEQVFEEGIGPVVERAYAWAADGTDGVYVTIDIDAIDPGLAPGTGHPEPGGLLPIHIIGAIRRLCRRAIVAVDIVEYHPEFDVANATGMLAAMIGAEALGAVARERWKQ